MPTSEPIQPQRPSPGPAIRTAKDALAAWDRGDALTVFEVESEGASQQAIWAAAFEAIRAGLGGSVDDANVALGPLSVRERLVTGEITKAALGHGWAKMLQIHRDVRPITIQKPAE
jgi:hypothetical protein